MKDQNKTKAQLIAELEKMRQQVSKLEKNQSVDRRAETALRESERRYRLLAEECDDGNRFSGDGCGVNCERETPPADGGRS